MLAKGKSFLFVLVIFTICGSVFAEWLDETILLSSDPEDEDNFGQSVCIDGNVCVVGAYGVEAYKGAAEIHRFNGADWVREQRISASDGVSYDRFGYSVDIDGNVCAVGAYGAGAAYVFRYNGSSWVQEQKLAPSDDPRIFGYVVAIDDDKCLVGSPTALVDGVTRGAVYSFKCNGSTWVQEQKLSASDGEFMDQFGEAVSISGNLCLIGMPNEDIGASNSGSAYVFEYVGDSWIEQQKLVPSGTINEWHLFGCSVAIDENNGSCLIGAKGDDIMADDAGAVYFYKYYSGSWTFFEKLFAPDATAHNVFGGAVSLLGDIFVVGSSGDDDLGSVCGSAYVFKKDENLRPPWKIIKLTASDGEYQDYFGTSVSISGNNALVGAPAGYKDPAIGSAYVYDLTCPSADLSGDCYVDFRDFATLAEQWLDGIKP
ncbi:MAG: hypothetical protein PVG93_01815 [Phycisphaerales bacterium]